MNYLHVPKGKTSILKIYKVYKQGNGDTADLMGHKFSVKEHKSVPSSSFYTSTGPLPQLKN